MYIVNYREKISICKSITIKETGVLTFG